VCHKAGFAGETGHFRACGKRVDEPCKSCGSAVEQHLFLRFQFRSSPKPAMWMQLRVDFRLHGTPRSLK
jgi:hypothetical protein